MKTARGMLRRMKRDFGNEMDVLFVISRVEFNIIKIIIKTFLLF